MNLYARRVERRRRRQRHPSRSGLGASHRLVGAARVARRRGRIGGLDRRAHDRRRLLGTDRRERALLGPQLDQVDDGEQASDRRAETTRRSSTSRGSGASTSSAPASTPSGPRRRRRPPSPSSARRGRRRTRRPSGPWRAPRRSTGTRTPSGRSAATSTRTCCPRACARPRSRARRSTRRSRRAPRCRPRSPPCGAVSAERQVGEGQQHRRQVGEQRSVERVGRQTGERLGVSGPTPPPGSRRRRPTRRANDGGDQHLELLVEAIFPLQREPSHLHDRPPAGRRTGPNPHLAPRDVERRQQAQDDEDSRRQHPADRRVPRDLERGVLLDARERHRQLAGTAAARARDARERGGQRGRTDRRRRSRGRGSPSIPGRSRRRTVRCMYRVSTPVTELSTKLPLPHLVAHERVRGIRHRLRHTRLQRLDVGLQHSGTAGARSPPAAGGS